MAKKIEKKPAAKKPAAPKKAVKKPAAKKVLKKVDTGARRMDVPPPPEVKQPGAVGFLGSATAESIMKQRLGSLANDCDLSYVPHMEDIRKALTSFYRYDVIARHKDGDVVLHYKFQLDHHGRMIPDQVVDKVNIKLTQKGL